jgi:hypothetical protein
VDTNSKQEDANESEVEDGVNQYGNSASLEVAKFYESVMTRHLNQQTWC